MTRTEEALQCFSSNFNCCQAVISVFCEENGLKKDLALKLGTGFGGGMRRGEVCGAVTGGIMVLGLQEGHYIENDLETKQRAYEQTVEFEKQFEKMNGSILCRELLGYDLTQGKELLMIKEKGLFDTICPKLIASAIQILEK